MNVLKEGAKEKIMNSDFTDFLFLIFSTIAMKKIMQLKVKFLINTNHFCVMGM